MQEGWVLTIFVFRCEVVVLHLPMPLFFSAHLMKPAFTRLGIHVLEIVLVLNWLLEKLTFVECIFNVH